MPEQSKFEYRGPKMYLDMLWLSDNVEHSPQLMRTTLMVTLGHSAVKLL